MRTDTSKISRILAKLKKNDPVLFRRVQKKIKQIASLPPAEIEHFKNLRQMTFLRNVISFDIRSKDDMSKYKRIRVGSFVLVFTVEGDVIEFKRFRHHDRAYRR